MSRKDLHERMREVIAAELLLGQVKHSLMLDLCERWGSGAEEHQRVSDVIRCVERFSDDVCGELEVDDQALDKIIDSEKFRKEVLGDV